ncbi:hypothetical protein ACI01nite_16820 [Acetobacter cibinongensis]|uniref:Outer membrane protein/adhesin family protein n=1 Tax=Acetobacter cibinongensis TaxID=146475 RepID=A0A0D6N012_9PROT|nr:Hint domain-containing protein [Acetobacter cibinongensis]GAN59332.1 outer membrane protein/adhesin family protein [Acetobacter cibinongensis]GBQ13661.1 hypothetical protein AA0482_0673 [Acetobacter cibinongensis NRIC 0482]GEL59080.1 hypothetical protein ACI01nite_16820 [Acetobacter cibinongensis]
MTAYVSPSGVTYTITPSFLGSTVTITDPDGSTTDLGYILGSKILTTDGGTLSIISLLGLGGGNYVIPPTISGNVTTLVALLSGATIYVGGTASINTAASVLSGATVNVNGGSATVGNNIIAGALSGLTVNLTNGGTFSNGSGLIALLNGTTITFGKGGGTFIANAGGTLLNLSGTTISGFDSAKDYIKFENLSDQPNYYQIATTTLGTGQSITVYNASKNVIATINVGGQSFTTGTYSATGVGPLTVSSDGTSLSLEATPAVCFVQGSLLRTPEGDRPVEDLAIGDTLVTFENGVEAQQVVTWVGSRQATVRPELFDDRAGYAVRIRKNAIGHGLPYEDLLVTAEHCLLFKGKFVPVRMLVNGSSIFYDKSLQHYTYYHVETEQHAVIIANGLQTESYMDTGNRRTFTQHGTCARLPSTSHKTWEQDAAAPLATDQLFVEPVFRALQKRAAALGLGEEKAPQDLTHDADIHLVTHTGKIIRCLRKQGSRVVFALPAEVQQVWLVSRYSRPADVLGAFVDDRRQLGVLVGGLQLCDKAGHITPLTDVLTAKDQIGWHGCEEGGHARWTTGWAEISLPPAQGQAERLLALDIKAGGPYLIQREVVANRVSVGS